MDSCNCFNIADIERKASDVAYDWGINSSNIHEKIISNGGKIAKKVHQKETSVLIRPSGEFIIISAYPTAYEYAIGLGLYFIEHCMKNSTTEKSREYHFNHKNSQDVKRFALALLLPETYFSNSNSNKEISSLYKIPESLVEKRREYIKEYKECRNENFLKIVDNKNKELKDKRKKWNKMKKQHTENKIVNIVSTGMSDFYDEINKRYETKRNYDEIINTNTTTSNSYDNEKWFLQLVFNKDVTKHNYYLPDETVKISYHKKLKYNTQYKNNNYTPSMVMRIKVSSPLLDNNTQIFLEKDFDTSTTPIEIKNFLMNSTLLIMDIRANY